VSGDGGGGVQKAKKSLKRGSDKRTKTRLCIETVLRICGSHIGTDKRAGKGAGVP